MMLDGSVAGTLNILIGSAKTHVMKAATDLSILFATTRATASAYAGQGTVQSHATRERAMGLVWPIVTTTCALVGNV